ncbi:hypothetical protein FRC02_006934 [Tulasnella sp. 418]|nr:hypothetical protein FRC02_006934 [Tulasnella sp. 418]
MVNFSLPFGTANVVDTQDFGCSTIFGLDSLPWVLSSTSSTFCLSSLSPHNCLRSEAFSYSVRSLIIITILDRSFFPFLACSVPQTLFLSHPSPSHYDYPHKASIWATISFFLDNFSLFFFLVLIACKNGFFFSSLQCFSLLSSPRFIAFFVGP